MDAPPADRRPWNPDPAWADPLIALLAAAVLFLSILVVARRQAPAPAAGVGLQGRLAELPFAGAKALPAARAALRRSLDQGPAGLEEAWDRAAVGVLLAEDGDLEGGRRLASGIALAGPAAAPFQRCWARAFEGGAAVPAEDRRRVGEALGGGWAAAVLDARLARLEGLDPGPGLQAAQDRALRRLAVLALAGLLLAGACLAGTAFGIHLAVARPPLPAAPPEPPALAPRALALVFLAWFLGLLLSGTLVSAVASALPFLAPFTVPLAYALHAAWGASLLASAQGTGLRRLWAALTPGRPLRALAWGLGGFALAVPAVLLTGLLLSPLLRHAAPPQRELLQALSALRSALPLLLAGATVALLAPAFEELLFRGTLLPWAARRWGWGRAAAATAVLFGLTHLQPAGLPTLAVLGLVLALVFRRAGSLWAPVLLHGLWNGGIFLFLRALTA